MIKWFQRDLDLGFHIELKEKQPRMEEFKPASARGPDMPCPRIAKRESINILRSF